MFHSGVKHDDLIHFHCLGVYMYPDATVAMQKKTNEQLEPRVKFKFGKLQSRRIEVRYCWHECFRSNLPGHN